MHTLIRRVHELRVLVEPLLFIVPVSSPDTTTALDDSNYGTSFPIVLLVSYSVPGFGLAHTCVIGSPMYITYDEQRHKNGMPQLLVRSVLLYSTRPRTPFSRVHMNARACAAQCCLIRRDQVASADLLLSSLLLLL